MKGCTRVLRRAGLITLTATFLSMGAALTPAAAAGGTFSAVDYGHFTITSCNQTPSFTCGINLQGAGTASFLGKIKTVANLIVNLTSIQACTSTNVIGAGTATAVLTPTDSIKFTVGGKACLSSGQQSSFHLYLYYKAAGGTGAFSKAAGLGVSYGTAVLSSATHYEVWHGTLTY